MGNKKVIIVTGASSGMGKAMALKLISDGHVVYGAARRIEKMKDLVKRGGNVLKLDITKDDSIVRLVNRVLKEQGRIDILVNNAGFGLFGAVEDTTILDAKYQFEVNLFGLGRITQLVIPHMRKNKSGTIINIASMGGRMYTLLGAWYHATKHALEGWSDCLRIELKQFGINVVIVEPGFIDTSFYDLMLKPMLKRSRNGVYGGLAKSLEYSTLKAKERGATSPPKVIADVVSRAVSAKNPRTRYLAGKYARLAVFARKYFGDRIYDWIVLRKMRHF